jgi:hypothetical protein
MECMVPNLPVRYDEKLVNIVAEAGKTGCFICSTKSQVTMLFVSKDFPAILKLELKVPVPADLGEAR